MAGVVRATLGLSLSPKEAVPAVEVIEQDQEPSKPPETRVAVAVPYATHLLMSTSNEGFVVMFTPASFCPTTMVTDLELVSPVLSVTVTANVYVPAKYVW